MHADLEFSEYIFCLTGEYVPQGLVKLFVLLSTQVKIFCMYVDHEYMKCSLLPTVTTLLTIQNFINVVTVLQVLGGIPCLV